jgi:hypothetical protein
MIVFTAVLPVRKVHGHIARIGGFAIAATDLHKARIELSSAQKLLQMFFGCVLAELWPPSATTCPASQMNSTTPAPWS